jgi:hypothetical protein
MRCRHEAVGDNTAVDRLRVWECGGLASLFVSPNRYIYLYTRIFFYFCLVQVISDTALGYMTYGLGFRVYGLGCMVLGIWFGAYGLELMVRV